MWAFPMHGDGSGATGAVAKMDGAERCVGGAIVYFVTKNCGDTAKRAAKKGGTIMKGKFSSANMETF